MKNFVAELKLALDIILFREPAMHAVAADKNKTKFGFAIIVVAALCGIIGQQFFMGYFKPTLTVSVISMATQLVAVVVGIYVISWVATKIFKGTASHDAFFRVVSYSMILGWASIIPMLGIITGLWALALLFVILTKVHKVTAGGAVGTILISLIVIAVVSAILSPFTGRYGYGSMMRGRGMMNSYYNFQVNP